MQTVKSSTGFRRIGLVMFSMCEYYHSFWVQGDAKSTHKPLYLKQYCQPERNTLEITVTSCCCVRMYRPHLPSAFFSSYVVLLNSFSSFLFPFPILYYLPFSSPSLPLSLLPPLSFPLHLPPIFFNSTPLSTCTCIFISSQCVL